jgi:hypothetical protein
MARLREFTILGLIGLATLSAVFSCSQGTGPQNLTSNSPVLITEPSVLTFHIPAGSETVSVQQLSIINKGAGSMNWVIGDNSPWITIQHSPDASGSQMTGLSVVVDAKNLSAGDYIGIVTVTSEGALNSPIYVPVYLTVNSSTAQKSQLVTTPDSTGASSSSSPPADTAAVWKNHTELYSYAQIRACIVSGSIANTDKIWYMRDIQIITKSGSSANIASTLQPGEQIIYYRYIPCFENEAVRLSYRWYR